MELKYSLRLSSSFLLTTVWKPNQQLELRRNRGVFFFVLHHLGFQLLNSLRLSLFIFHNVPAALKAPQEREPGMDWYLAPHQLTGGINSQTFLQTKCTNWRKNTATLSVHVKSGLQEDIWSTKTIHLLVSGRLSSGF